MMTMMMKWQQLWSTLEGYCKDQWSIVGKDIIRTNNFTLAAILV
jgi:hypothetical protein